MRNQLHILIWQIQTVWKYLPQWHDGKWRQWQRYASDVNWCWCWCWCCWRWRRPGESFKMFQATVSHLWIVAKVLQMPGKYCSNPFQHAFQLEVSTTLLPLCRGSWSAVSPFPSSSSPSSSLPPAAMASKCESSSSTDDSHSIKIILETWYDVIKISVCCTQRLAVPKRSPLQSWLERLMIRSAYRRFYQILHKVEKNFNWMQEHFHPRFTLDQVNLQVQEYLSEKLL